SPDDGHPGDPLGGDLGDALGDRGEGGPQPAGLERLHDGSELDRGPGDEQREAGSGPQSTGERKIAL
ncbi:MAG: hypothetical protein ACRDK3_00750, partial [Actinomycetota bacterium]